MFVYVVAAGVRKTWEGSSHCESLESFYKLDQNQYYIISTARAPYNPNLEHKPWTCTILIAPLPFRTSINFDSIKGFHVRDIRPDLAESRAAIQALEFFYRIGFMGSQNAGRSNTYNISSKPGFAQRDRQGKTNSGMLTEL